MSIQRKILLSAFLIMVAIIILVCKPFKVIKKFEIERQVVEFLNTGKIAKYIYASDADDLNYAKDTDVNIYNIDDFIEYFIDYINKCILIKLNKLNKSSIKELFVKGDYKNITISFNNIYVDSVISRINDSDIDMYNKGLLEKHLIRKLENVIEHKSNNLYKDWYITGNTKRSIELPYGIYIKYTPNDKTNLNEVKEIILCKITEPISNLDNLKRNGGDIKCTIEYQNNQNEIKQLSRVLLVKNDNNKLKYSTRVLLQNLLYTQSENPSMYVSQHDYDKEQEEWSKMVDEMERKRHEDDGNPLVKQYFIIIPPFEKKIQSAYLLINEYEDNSLSIDCVLIKRIKKDGEIGDDIRQYTLPYEDITTKEEALERYLSDKEHYDADEKWLKEGNIDYKGD